MFCGHLDQNLLQICHMMSFQGIRVSLRLYPEYDYYLATIDPLWHSRYVLNHFQKNCTSFAVPMGVMSYDESTIRCKGRTVAQTFMKSKPVRFGIRLYALVYQ